MCGLSYIAYSWYISIVSLCSEKRHQSLAIEDVSMFYPPKISTGLNGNVGHFYQLGIFIKMSYVLKVLMNTDTYNSYFRWRIDN